VPVLLHPLGPNYRPQQVTDDLRSFWTNTYPQVRKELRARSPKHAWPDDPWTAAAESRPRRKAPQSETAWTRLSLFSGKKQGGFLPPRETLLSALGRYQER
jgi:hypothetical protein